MSAVVAAGILISGAGTNLQALIDRIVAGRLDCAIRVVISNRPDAAGLTRARAAGIPTRVIDHRHFATREDFDRALVEALRAAEVELVLLAGFDRLITAAELSGRPRCPEAAQLLGANGEDLATTQDGPDDRAVPMTSVVAAPPPEKAGRDDNGRLPSHHWMSGGGTGGSGPRTTTRRPSTASRPSAKSWIALA